MLQIRLPSFCPGAKGRAPVWAARLQQNHVGQGSCYRVWPEFSGGEGIRALLHVRWRKREGRGQAVLPVMHCLLGVLVPGVPRLLLNLPAEPLHFLNTPANAVLVLQFHCNLVLKFALYSLTAQV